jgi:hypothetical protein
MEMGCGLTRDLRTNSTPRESSVAIVETFGLPSLILFASRRGLVKVGLGRGEPPLIPCRRLLGPHLGLVSDLGEHLLNVA